jgi:hypothetical protein
MVLTLLTEHVALPGRPGKYTFVPGWRARDAGLYQRLTNAASEVGSKRLAGLRLSIGLLSADCESGGQLLGVDWRADCLSMPKSWSK